MEWRRTRKAMHRYGEPDFDAGYMKWGLTDPKTQIEEAESILRLIHGAGPQNILDLACGVGTHAIHWARQGHVVHGVDLSETFISKANENARNVQGVSFSVGDIRSLDLPGDFSLITWIEMSFIDASVLQRVHQWLAPGGFFICDVRNPDHPKVKSRALPWRTWRENDGVFVLERHEINPTTGQQEDAWVTVDPARHLIQERLNVSEPGLKTDPSKTIQALKLAGFASCELRTMSGVAFHDGPETYWLWLLARK